MSEEFEDNGSADAIAVVVLMLLALLGTIHFVYTGGLPAFIDFLF